MARLNYDVTLPMGYKNTKLFEIVDEFISSGREVAEYVFADDEYTQAQSAANALKGSLRRRHITSVFVTIRLGRVFLIRKENANA